MGLVTSGLGSCSPTSGTGLFYLVLGRKFERPRRKEPEVLPSCRKPWAPTAVCGEVGSRLAES